MAKTATLTCVFIFYIMFDLAKVQHMDSQKFLKTKWMTHLGCFRVIGLGDSTNVKMTNITNNQPKICSRQCGNWNFFALLGFKCFCFNEVTFKNLYERKLNECHRKCPDYTDTMYCGSNDMKYMYANVYRLEKDKPAIPKLPFKIAKQYCENSRSKLIRFNESLPEKTEDNINYWVGTFRQRIFRHEYTDLVYTLIVGRLSTNYNMKFRIKSIGRKQKRFHV